MDIYFTPEWGKVNQYIEEGEPFIFECNTGYGVIKNQFILRKVPQTVEGNQFYDIVSLYGYGGPYIEWCREGREQSLLKEYEKKFSEYCVAHGIVSEFVRVHPIQGNSTNFKEIYGSECIRHTVGTDLTGDDPVQKEFSKSDRKYVRRALKTGVTWDVLEAPADASGFTEIYYSTMDRDHATDFYYFPEEYFRECVRLLGDHIILVRALFEGRVIAKGLYLTYGTTIHAHLSGTLKEYIHLSPAYVVKYATAVWGKEHGYKLIHYGGGTSNNPDDSLFQFKCKFTKGTLFDFYVGRKVWNPEIYERLVEMTGKHDTEFFPAYRG